MRKGEGEKRKEIRTEKRKKRGECGRVLKREERKRERNTYDRTSIML